MKLLLLLIGLAGLAAYVLPGRLEVTPTPCLALDARAARLIEASRLPMAGRAVEPSRVVGDLVQRHVPFLPPEIGCAAAYWLTVYQPDLTRLVPGLAGGRG